ncbi:MAG: glutamate--tRNA ligase [Proteobacteria bacterium]|nr:glutamate--tRNA ligase [Pseudomonadota bacterium]
MIMVRTRFAPSPTGYLHIGGARTALFNFLFARNQGGKFILRIEDTDVERSTDESVQAILDGMNWLGLSWDEGPFFQSKRMDRYKLYAERLLEEGKAYYCYCQPEELQERRERALKDGKKPTYDRRCRERKDVPAGLTPVIRFKAPQEGQTIVEDLIKGTVVFNNNELDDLIIIRSDGYPTYNFAVVIDDVDMAITHIIRGDDHLNNTPRQIQIYNALNFPVPKFAHVPMILGSDKTRLSKRHGATSVMAYKEMGYINKALINYLVRLGWSCGDQEIFSMDEMIEKFNIENIGKSAAVFNPEKLLWLNSHYIKTMDIDELLEISLEYFKRKHEILPERDVMKRIINSLKERSKTLVELADSSGVYFYDDFDYDTESVKKFFPDRNSSILSYILEQVKKKGLADEKDFESLVRGTAELFGVKVVVVAQQIRIALSGKTVSPSLYDIISIIGIERTIRRFERFMDFLSKG